MRIPPHSVALAATVAAALALPGCAQEPPPIIPTAQPTSAPVFRSDAEALAAAKEAYTGYLAASDQIAHDGGIEIDRLKTWVTSSQLERDMVAFTAMQVQSHHTVGSSDFSHFTLQSASRTSGKAQVVVYVCAEIGGTKLLDNSGADVGEGRPLSVPLEVSFVSDPAEPKKLLVDRGIQWSGTDFC